METTLAWAAGLFEGEGTITVCRGRTRLAVKMTDEEAVRRFTSVIRTGKMYGPYGPYESQMGTLPTYVWIAESESARRAANRMLPWLGDRCRERLSQVTLITT